AESRSHGALLFRSQTEGCHAMNAATQAQPRKACKTRRTKDESMKAAVRSVVVAMAMILGVRATAAGQPAPADLSATPALAEAEQKIRTELALTPEQEAKALALITERLGKAEQVVDSF